MTRHLDLMRLHDEELGEDQRQELEDELDDDDRDVLDGLVELGDLLRAHADDVADPASNIADNVMSRIDELPRLAVVEQPRPRPQAAPILITGLVLAAAAAFMLWLKAAPDTAPPRAPGPSTAELPMTATLPNPEPLASEPAAGASEENAPAIAIEAVDFGNQGGSIFVVGDESTPVVWLVDEPPGARMEKL